MYYQVFETEKNKRKLKLKTKCSFKEFIENHVKVMPGGGHIKLTPAQHAFIDFIEENKGRKIIWLKSRSGGIDYISKLYKEYIGKDIK